MAGRYDNLTRSRLLYPPVRDYEFCYRIVPAQRRSGSGLWRSVWGRKDTFLNNNSFIVSSRFFGSYIEVSLGLGGIPVTNNITYKYVCKSRLSFWIFGGEIAAWCPLEEDDSPLDPPLLKEQMPGSSAHGIIYSSSSSDFFKVDKQTTEMKWIGISCNKWQFQEICLTVFGKEIGLN